MTIPELKSKIASLIKADRYADAFIECGKALRVNPNDDEILVICSFLFKRIQDAHIEIDCKTAEDFVLRGIAKYYAGDTDGALSDYNDAILLDPDHSYTYKCRHMVHAANSRINDAINDIQKAIMIDQTGEYYNDFGILLGLLQKKNESLICHSKAVELSPDVAQYWYNFGVELMSQEYLQDALVKYNKAIELWPGYEDALVNREYVQGLLRNN